MIITSTHTSMFALARTNNIIEVEISRPMAIRTEMKLVPLSGHGAAKSSPSLVIFRGTVTRIRDSTTAESHRADVSRWCETFRH